MISSGQGPLVGDPSPSLSLRRVNMAAVLQHAWDVEELTASDVMAATGLTRSTALARLDDLVALGWLRELDEPRVVGERVKGRPARRYAFRPRAAPVVGIDAGQHRLTVCVADLRGHELARAERLLHTGDEGPAVRVALLDDALADALRAAGAAADAVLVTVVGIPAPADLRGRSPVGRDAFWQRMNSGFADVLATGRPVVVDNDANLAAIAEASIGAGTGVSSFVALLSGERFGAGLVVDGRLLRGRHGGAGEMHMLDFVDGVGSAHGLGALAREWAAEAIGAGDVPEASPMRRRDPHPPELVDVVDAAGAGEAAAADIVGRLADRLARISAAVASLLDVELVVVGGAMAHAAGPVIELAADRVGPDMHLPAPRITASTLGADSVTLGAVHTAVAHVRADPLRFDLSPRAVPQGRESRRRTGGRVRRGREADPDVQPDLDAVAVGRGAGLDPQ